MLLSFLLTALQWDTLSAAGTERTSVFHDVITHPPPRVLFWTSSNSAMLFNLLMAVFFDDQRLLWASLIGSKCRRYTLDTETEIGS